MILQGLLLGTLLFIITFLFVNWVLSVKPYKGPVTPHFNGKTFRNPSQRGAKGFKSIFEYMFKRQPDKWPSPYEDFVRSEPLPVPNKDDIQYTFVNHSTFLIQHQGLNILTDPIWSKRCSPFQFMGPARTRPPGLKFEDLPPIDLVLVSHNHYDHLDKPTIKKLNQKHNPQYITPLGVGNVIKKWGGEKITEIDWWQSTNFKDLEIKALPANHFSSRGMFDRDTTQWAGFSILSNNKKIYYVGDTGYSDVFKLIGEKEGPFDLSFIPIGAYLPKWFMSPIHVCPEESVMIHNDVGSKKSVAMHFGTFKLADDDPRRSNRELKEALKVALMSEDDFMIPDEGECYREV